MEIADGRYARTQEYKMSFLKMGGKDQTKHRINNVLFYVFLKSSIEISRR